MTNILEQSFRSISQRKLQPTDFGTRVVISKSFLYPGIEGPSYLALEYLDEKNDFHFDPSKLDHTRLNIIVSATRNKDTPDADSFGEINFRFSVPEEKTIVVSPFVHVFGEMQGLGIGKHLMQLTDIVMDHALQHITGLEGKKVLVRITDNAHEYSRGFEDLDCHGKLPKRRGWTSHVVKHTMHGFTRVKDLSLRDPVFEKVYRQ